MASEVAHPDDEQAAARPNGAPNGTASHQTRQSKSESLAALLASSPDDDAATDGGALPFPQLQTDRRDAPSSDGDSSSSHVASPVTSPPYWLQGHGRTASTASAESVLPAEAITLRDNETADADEEGGAEAWGSRSWNDWNWRGRNRACWAKSVEVSNYVVVNGSATNIGAFVVWNIKVETLSGSYMNIRKRYSEFDDFRRRLIQTFPGFEAAVPVLPPKSVIAKFRPRFLEKRRAGLQYFLNCILLNPEFSGSPVLKDFLFA